MVRHKSIFGRCRLCGERTDLTFEHIPPRSSNNKNTVYSISSFEDSLNSGNPLNPKIKGVHKQGGTGNYSLCTDCNSFLGRTYVNSYNGWVGVGFYLLKQYRDSPITFSIEEFEPLKVLKQIFSMFISMEDEDCYDRHKDLCDYIRNSDSNELPEKYQILTYLNNEGDSFYIPPLCHGNFKTGTVVFCSELTFSPFGYVFTIGNNNPIDKLTDITSFNRYKIEDRVSLIFQNLHKLPKHLPLPLDYRTEEEIKNDMKK